MQIPTQIALRCANGLALILIYLQHLVALLRYLAPSSRVSKANTLKSAQR